MKKIFFLLFLINFTVNLNSQSWKCLTSTISYPSCVFCEKKLIIVGTRNGEVFISNDEGLNWNKIELGSASNHVTSIILADSSIYVRLAAYSNGSDIWKINLKDYKAKGLFASGYQNPRSRLALGSDGIVYFNTIYGIHKIINDSPVQMKNTNYPDGIAPYDFVILDTNYFLTNDFGLWKRTPNTAWKSFNEGLPEISNNNYPYTLYASNNSLFVAYNNYNIENGSAVYISNDLNSWKEYGNNKSLSIKVLSMVEGYNEDILAAAETRLPSSNLPQCLAINSSSSKKLNDGLPEIAYIVSLTKDNSDKYSRIYSAAYPGGIFYLENILNIDNNIGNEFFELFPIPANDIINIKSDKFFNVNYSIFIYDEAGAFVKKLNGFSEDGTIRIKTSDFSSKLLFFNLKAENYNFKGKIVIQ
jgi:hypothetical protein